MDSRTLEDSKKGNTMKNWETLEADIDLILDTHYTSGRDGREINKIIVHHNAANLTVRGCYNVWQTREASAHYQVEDDGTIGQLVRDRNTAWHAGNWDANTTSIGIEHANNHIGEPWTISEATLDNGAHLVAALCVFYKLGEPHWGVNVFGHRQFSATACPGEIAGTQNEAYMQRARHWYNVMTRNTTAAEHDDNTTAATHEHDPDALADAVIRGQYGNGAERVHALGVRYAVVQAIVNKRLGYPVDLDTLANAVIKGTYGNGTERVNALGSIYTDVQNRVNQKLGL